MTDAPQIYLVTPPEVDAGFAARLEAVLDAHPVACLRPVATNRRDAIGTADDGYCHCELRIPGARIAADDGAVKNITGAAHAFIQLLDISQADATGQSDGGHRIGRKAGHGGAVAEISVHHLSSDRPRGVVSRIEMHAVEHLIDPDEQQVFATPGHAGKVITDADDHSWIGLLSIAQPADELELTHHG